MLALGRIPRTICRYQVPMQTAMLDFTVIITKASWAKNRDSTIQPTKIEHLDQANIQMKPLVFIDKCRANQLPKEEYLAQPSEDL